MAVSVNLPMLSLLRLKSIANRVTEYQTHQTKLGRGSGQTGVA